MAEKNRCLLVESIIVLLMHWGRVKHIYVSKLNIICSDNDLAPCRRQAIIWTSGGILLTGHLGTNVSEIVIEIHTFSFKIMHLIMSFGKWRTPCLDLSECVNLPSTGSWRIHRYIFKRMHFKIIYTYHIAWWITIHCCDAFEYIIGCQLAWMLVGDEIDLGIRFPILFWLTAMDMNGNRLL